MLDVRRLRVLREVAARGTLAAAADALSYTPSAVSQQLARLQAELGVPLLEPAGRSVRLTEPGRRLARRADAVIALLEEAEVELTAGTGEITGTVRVASFQTAALALLPPALKELERRHPGLRVEYLEAEAEESLPAVAMGELDLAMAEEYGHAPRPRDHRLLRRELGRDPILVALPMGHALGGAQPAVRLAGLADEEWVTSLRGALFDEMVERACRSVGGFEPDVTHRANDIRIILSLIAAGKGVSLVPGLGNPETMPGISVHRIAEQPLFRTIFTAIRRSAAADPGIAAVHDALGAAAAGLDERVLAAPE
jgi:DNA-binding transcriptional LysR family regulator